MTAATLPGRALEPRDLSALAKSGISEATARRALLRRVTSIEGGPLVGRNGSGDYAGVIFPYQWPGEEHIREVRLRRDKPDVEYGPDGKPKDKGKYLSAPGRGSMLYVPPGTLAEWLSDPDLPAVLVEGEKKGLALSDLAWHGAADSADRPAFLSLAIPGVWNWRATIGKQNGPDGERRDVKGVIPDFERVNWIGRKVIVAFDTNVASNSAVRAAREQLSQELKRRRAKVYWLHWPADVPDTVNGIDDYIGQFGKDAAGQLLERAQPHGQAAPDFRVWTLDRLRRAHLPVAKPIAEGLLNEGEMVALIGKPKQGKSRLAQQAALDFARGRAFLGHAVPTPRRVLYLDLENRPEGARARFSRMAEAHESDRNILLYVPETLAENGVTLASDAGIKNLGALVADVAPDVLIVDTWRLLLGGDENKAEVVLRGLRAVSGLRQALPKLGVILIHHVRKSSPGGENQPRLRIDPSAWVEHASGAYAFIGHVDACFGLEREIDGDSGEEIVVFGGVARSTTPHTLLLEEDPETLLFRPATGEEPLAQLLTPKERDYWQRIRALEAFTFTQALQAAGTKNKKAVSRAIRKALDMRVLTQGLDKVYRLERAV